jgi:uridine monophosphate synthetase
VRAFFERLSDRARQADSLLCVGLDPHPELLREPSAGAARDFCLGLIESTAEHACAFKPNSAFFERFGAAGWGALREVIAAVPPETPVILDAKRGDIASTAQAYAAAAFEQLGASAVTLSPYLGREALAPFLGYPGRGVFVLCKTSNPSADEVQRLAARDGPLYLEIARLAQRWAGPEQLGLVVGATDAEALAAVRRIAPQSWLLAPGVGPQGAELEPALRAGLRADGLGLLLPVSRAIAGAKHPGRVAEQLREAINRVRQRLGARVGAPHPAAGVSELNAGPPSRQAAPESLRIAKVASVPAVEASGAAPPLSVALGRLADDLLAAGCVRFGEFRLKSGMASPIYFDLRLLAGSPELLYRVAEAYLPLLEVLAFDRLAAVPYAGLPVGTALALKTGKPLIYPRKERKSYGTGQAVEGGHRPGETALLIDDLATTGGSKLEAIETLRSAGLRVADVAVLIDREGGASAELAAAGCQLHAVFALSQLLEHWERSDQIEPERIEAVRSFLAQTT